MFEVSPNSIEETLQYGFTLHRVSSSLVPQLSYLKKFKLMVSRLVDLSWWRLVSHLCFPRWSWKNHSDYSLHSFWGTRTDSLPSRSRTLRHGQKCLGFREKFSPGTSQSIKVCFLFIDMKNPDHWSMSVIMVKINTWMNLKIHTIMIWRTVLLFYQLPFFIPRPEPIIPSFQEDMPIGNDNCEK